MLIKIGDCMVDPVSVVGVAPQEVGDDKVVILVWMDSISHPIIHSEWQGDHRDEIRRIGDLLEQSTNLLKSESREFSEDGAIMVRIRKDELEEQAKVAYQAGWEDASRRSTSRMDVHILESSLYSLAAGVVSAIKDTPSDNLESEGASTILAEGVRMIIEKVANIAGVSVKWEA